MKPFEHHLLAAAEVEGAKAVAYEASGNVHAGETHRHYEQAYMLAAASADAITWLADEARDARIESIALHNYEFVNGGNPVGFADMAEPYLDEAEKLYDFLLDKGWTPPVP